MQILDILRQAQGGKAIDNLARTFDLPPDSAAAVVDEVLPELAFGLERNTLSRKGVADLIEALGSGRHARYAEDAAILSDPDVREDGNNILGHILRSKARSRRVAARASASTGISAGIIKAMLPYIASILMGSLAKSTQGGLGDILKRLPQLGGAGARPKVSSEAFPLPAPASGGGIGGGQMLPIPDESTLGRGGRGSAGRGSAGRRSAGRGGNPYRDIGDVLRRGGSGGNSLWKMLRGLLGGILGFQSRGIVSWLFRLIVMRYGWRIVQFVFGRLFRFR